MTFKELNLIEPISEALTQKGYSVPTPIQSEAIPLILNGDDILGCAQTGSGKTAAFSIPIIQRIYEQKQSGNPRFGIKALVLTPTRELAIQINDSFEAYGSKTGLKHTVIFGGVGQKPQTDALEAGVDVLIATPGRLLDLYGQGFVTLMHLEYFVLDEADHMLDMGFLPDIKRILPLLPKRRQSLFFSATMPPVIENLANSILTNPQKVEVTPASSTVEKIEQYIFYVEKKGELLLELLQRPEMRSVLVFTRTKHGADKVAKLLNKNDIPAAAIHGNKGQTTRQNTLSEFKKGTIRVLIATDIAARGIDVDSLSHVVNYELPNVPETYVHRIGRTGRAGKAGFAFSFCHPEEVPLLRDIEKLIGKKIEVAMGNPYQTDEVMAAVENKKAAVKEEIAKRNMYGSRRDGSYYRNKKRAESGVKKGAAPTKDDKPRQKGRSGSSSNADRESFDSKRVNSGRSSRGRGGFRGKR